MKKWIVTFAISVSSLLALNAKGQNIVNTYIDPCDSKVYTFVAPIASNSPGVLVIVRGKSRLFTYADFASGTVDAWVKSIFATPCPVSQQATTIIEQCKIHFASMTSGHLKAIA